MPERQPIDFQAYKANKVIQPAEHAHPVEPDSGAAQWAAEARMIKVPPSIREELDAQRTAREQEHLTMSADAARRLIEAIPGNPQPAPSEEQVQPQVERGRVTVPMPPNPYKVPGYTESHDK